MIWILSVFMVLVIFVFARSLDRIETKLTQIQSDIADANSKLDTIIRWGNRIEEELKQKLGLRFFRY